MVRLNNKKNKLPTSTTCNVAFISYEVLYYQYLKFALAASVSTLVFMYSHNTQAETVDAQSSIFIPDYLYPDDRVKGAIVEGTGEDRHFSGYGLDNTALETSAAHFFDTSLNTTQRLMNHNWIYQSYHEIELQSGSRFFSNFLKSTLKTYWQSLHEKKLSHTALPDATGEGKIKEFDYKMRLKNDAIKVSVKYEF